MAWLKWDQASPLAIEVLRSVKGLTTEELDDAVPVSVDGLIVRLLSPPKVLKAKLCNAVTLDQTERNDVNHVRIMVLCVREFILDVLESVIAGDAAQRDLIDLLEDVREYITEPNGRRAELQWNLDLSHVWPRKELEESGLQKILRFVQHRLPGSTDSSPFG